MMQRREQGDPPAKCQHCGAFMCLRAITGKCGMEPPPAPKAGVKEDLNG